MANEIQAKGETEVARRGAYPGSYPYGGPRGGVIDGPKWARLIFQHYKMFLAIVAIVVVLGVLFTARQTKIYTTKSAVMLDQRKQQILQDESEVVSGLPSDSSAVDTEVQLLNSPGLAYRVARKLNLVPAGDPARLTITEQRAVSDAVRGILENRSAQRVGSTYIIEITGRSPNPQLAQDLANAYATAYVESQVDVRVQASARVRAHLEQEIVKLRKEVKSADAATAQYKADHGLTDTSAAGTLTEQEISSYNQALTLARAQAAEDARRLSAARSQLAQGSDSMGDASPALVQLRSQESTISNHIADLSTRYGPNHPELVTARQQLEDVRRLIAAQSGRTIAGLQAQAEASAGRVSAIEARLASTEGALARAGTAGVQLRELEMRLDAPQKALEAYQARLVQLSTQVGAEQPDARIVSLAPLPTAPSSPNWILNLALSIVLGIILGLMAVLARILLSVGVASADEVELSLGVDFLAALPSVKDADDLTLIDKVVDEPTSAFAEALRALATSVLFTGSAPPRILALSSSFAEEGKSTTSIALGRVIALRGRRVVVIDCDVQRPSFHQRFGLGGDRGLVEVLRDELTFEQAIVPDDRSPAHFLSLGRGLDPSLSLDETAMQKLLDELSLRYDVVMLDLPPVLQVAETRVFAGLADTTVMLVRWKRTSRQAIDQALSILLRANATVIGIALTQVPSSSGRALYGYSRPTLNRIEAPAA